MTAEAIDKPALIKDARNFHSSPAKQAPRPSFAHSVLIPRACQRALDSCPRPQSQHHPHATKCAILTAASLPFSLSFFFFDPLAAETLWRSNENDLYNFVVHN